MIDWTTDPDMRRRAQVGLNKGEAHHALKRAISFHQRGELRDRTEEGQHYRVAGLNLLTAIIIYWNTLKLGAARLRQQERRPRDPGRIPGPHLASWMGTHQLDRRIPLAGCRFTSRAETLSVVFRPLPQTTRSGQLPCRGVFR